VRRRHAANDGLTCMHAEGQQKRVVGGMQGFKSVAKAGPAPPDARVLPVAWLDRLPGRQRAQLAERQRPLLRTGYL
jgi:hypothetical protein